MKIGIVTTSYPRWPGDYAGSFVWHHQQWLQQRGHETIVVCAGASNGSLDRTLSAAATNAVKDGISDNTNIRQVADPHSLFYSGGAPDALEASKKAWWHGLGFSYRLLKQCRRSLKDCDAVVSHWMVPSGIVASLCFPKKKHLIVCHSGGVHVLGKFHGIGMAELLFRRRPEVRFSFVSRDLLQLWQKNIPKKWHQTFLSRSIVCPMGIDDRAFDFAHHVPSPTIQNAMTEDYVLFIGRLTPVKGVDILLRALQGTKIACVIVGDGPQRQQLQQLAASLGVDAQFTGVVTGDKKWELLARARAVICPSRITLSGRTEGSPMTALEALAAGKQVIASCVGGLKDMPVQLVPPEDPSALRAAITQIFAAMGKNKYCPDTGQQYAQQYRWENVGNRLWDHWQTR